MTAEREGADVEAVLAGAFDYTIYARDGRPLGTRDGYLTKWEAEALAARLAPLIAERERVAAERALREAAGDLNTTDHATETALAGIDHVLDWLRDRADTYAEGGER